MQLHRRKDQKWTSKIECRNDANRGPIGDGITMHIQRIPANVHGREQLKREAGLAGAVTAAAHNAGMFFHSAYSGPESTPRIAQ